MDSEAWNRLEKIVIDQLFDALKRRVCVLVSDGGSNIFSGLLMRHDGDHYIATAYHGVTRVVDGSSLVIQTFAGPCPAPAVLVDPSSNYDAGRDLVALRLDDFTASSLGAEWITPDDVLRGTLRAGEFVVAIGFPDKEVRAEPEQGIMRVEPRPFLMKSSVIPTPPELVRPGAKEIDDDFFIAYDDKDITGYGGVQLLPIKPTGVSGSGVFLLHPFCKGVVWSGQSALAGVATDWYPDARCLRVRRACFLMPLVGASIDTGG